MKIKITSCCSLPVDEKGFLIEFPEEDMQIPTRAKNVCPTCGQKGKPVDAVIMQSFLPFPLRQVENAEYFFCSTRACPVAYFSGDGERICTIGQVREVMKLAETPALATDEANICKE